MNAKKILLFTAAAVMTLGSAAHAQIAFRSATSANTSGGGAAAPQLRSTSVRTSRLYVQNVAASVDPATERGAWDVPGSYLARKLSATRPTSAGTKALAETSTTNNYDVLLVKAVSDSIPYAQTIAGTVTWVLGGSQSSAAMNAFWHVHIYVLRSSDTLVGTLYNNYVDPDSALDVDEWPAPAKGDSHYGGPGHFGGPGTPLTLTPVAVLASDRIVIEIGYQARNTVNTSFTGTLYLGGTTATTDLSMGGGNVTTEPGWFEFSQYLGFMPTGTSPIVIHKPSGTVAGDVMIATIGFRSDTAVINTPAEWTLVRRVNQSSTACCRTSSLAIYRRTADASDASVSSYTWTVSGLTAHSAAIRSFSGVDTANPDGGIVVENGQPTPQSASHATPDVTTTVANTLLVATYEYPYGETSWSPPAGMSEDFDFSSQGATFGTASGGSSGVQAAAGATGAKTATATGVFTTSIGATHILALRGVGGGGGSTTLTINKPAGVVQNDVMIASITVGPSTATIDPPPSGGWTLVGLRMNNTNGTSNSLAVYSKRAGPDASEPASYDWTFSPGHTGAAGGIMAFSDADPTIEVDSGQNTPSGTAHATPSVSTALPNTMIITSHSVGAASTTWTPPTGMTERVAASGGSAALEMNHVLQAVAGSTSKSATSSSTATGNAHILALRRVLGSFNGFETDTTTAEVSAGKIKTKIAGTSVSVDIAALNAAKGALAAYFIGTVRVEVVDASDSTGAVVGENCRSSWPQILAPWDVTFAASDGARKNTSFTLTNSFRNARLRFTYPAGAPTVTACSTDNFALRPKQFNVSFKDNDAVTANTSGPGRTLDNLTAPGGIVHKAGQPFTVRATPVNGDGTGTTPTTNYTGTVTAQPPGDCGATNACVDTPSGVFTLGAGSVVSGVFTSHAATYSDVGAIAVTLVDSGFADVDAGALDTPGDCTAAGRYVCGTTNVGRFVPDHFAVAYNVPSFSTACAAGGFTYVGQRFNYTSAPVITVTAQNAANATTVNYTGDLWQITDTSLINKTYTAASGTLDVSGIPVTPGADPLIQEKPGSPGVGTLTFRTPSFFTPGSGFFFTRTNTPVAAFNAEVSLAIDVIDADGVLNATNPARFGQASAGNGIDFSSGKSMRFGRLALRNANGSQLVDLRVPVEAQYWDYTNAAHTGLGFITNTADSCTSIANNNVAMDSFSRRLAPCETFVNGAVALIAGRGTLRLRAPGSTNDGTVRLTVNLGSSNSGTTCTALGGETDTVDATGAGWTYLQGNWTGSNYDQNPKARAAFGVFKGAEEVIDMRENF